MYVKKKPTKCKTKFLSFPDAPETMKTTETITSSFSPFYPLV